MGGLRHRVGKDGKRRVGCLDRFRHIDMRELDRVVAKNLVDAVVVVIRSLDDGEDVADIQVLLWRINRVKTKTPDRVIPVDRDGLMFVQHFWRRTQKEANDIATADNRKQS